MRRIRTYVINLKEAKERKTYMSELLSSKDLLDVVFIDAVNGKSLTVADLERSVDQNIAFRRYGRVLLGGEVGCTLSHMKCAQALLESDEQVAIVFEDDLVLQEREIDMLLYAIREEISTIGPTIVLFSGDYWFSRRRKFYEKYQLATVIEAVCSQAYMINRAAAEKMLSMGSEHTADDWSYIKKAGINILALYPHIADQNRLDFNTDVSPAYTGFIRKNLSWSRRLESYFMAFLKMTLKRLGHFEYKQFKW